MRDDSLLKLENKLNNYSSKDIISSKFILKPEISRIDLSKGKDFVKNIGSFVEKFKIQNNEILNDKKKLEDLNIESETLLNKNLRRKKNNSQPEVINTENNLENNTENNIEKKPEKKFIEMNLKLGILDLIKKKPLIEAVDKVEGEDLENDSEKKETNLEKMTSIIKTDDILNSIFNERIKNTSNSEDYPFIDFKNDNFNKEILNFLLENSGGNNKKKKNKNIQGETSHKKINKNRNVVSNKRKIEK